MTQPDFHNGCSHWISSLQTFTAYLERLEQFYIANDIRQCAADATEAVKKVADKKKVAVLISVIGSKTYNTLRDLCSPLARKEKSFSEICELLKSHYKPKNLEVAGSFKFHSCVHAESESIAEYSARLRRLATACNFGTFLPRAVWDQFVSGIRDGNTKKKLLSQDISTLEDAMTTAIADDAVKGESQLFQTNPIHVVKARPSNNHKKGRERDSHRSKRQISSKSTKDKKPFYTCCTCGESGHSRKHRKHRDKVCRLCNLKGHMAKVCRKTGEHSVRPDFLRHHSYLEGDM